MQFDIVVAGGGAAGLAAAGLLAASGHEVVLISPAAVRPDSRTVALMQSSVRLLEHLSVWSDIEPAARPLRKLTLVDDTGDYIAAPRLSFSAQELGLEAFGWNIPLSLLVTCLRRTAVENGVRFTDGSVSGLSADDKAIEITLPDRSQLHCKLLIAADGLNSPARQAAEIFTQHWEYDQAAIAASFTHSGDHQDVSIEFLRTGGPLTTVPLPEGRSSLVWMERSERAGELAAMSDSDFCRELQAALHGELGLISAPGPRSIVPMQGLLAPDFGAKRVLLVGEAAHFMPPIGAQGLNLGLRDAATAAELVTAAFKEGNDPGDERILRRYASLRRRDVLPRQAVIDTFNRSLLADLLPVNLLRTAGVAVAAHLPPLRRYIMQQGLEPTNLPKIMRARAPAR